jgi:hypothetical protein
MNTFSVSSIPCKSFDNKHTLFNSEIHFSTNVDGLSTPLTKTHYYATYCNDKIRPPDSVRLSAPMTHPAIGSYRSNLREICLLCAGPRYPQWLNTLYLGTMKYGFMNFCQFISFVIQLSFRIS